MKIFLPAKLSPTGGTSSFARKFQQGMASQGHIVTFKPTSDYDLLLVSPRCPLKYLQDAKKRNKPIIHRLDGVYYPATTSGWLFPIYNAPLNIIRDHFASHVIYQSQYSKQLCQRFLLPIKHSLPSSVIYNGVDTKLFSPTGPKINLHDNPNQKVIITWSRFRRPDQIDPLIAVFKHYQNHYQSNSKLIIIGNFEKQVSNRPHRYQSESIKFLGPIPNLHIPQYARSADAFLITHQNPPCPNNVIEAMACGLPICAVADGAMPEIVADKQCGQLLPVSNHGYLKSRTLKPSSLANKLHSIITGHQANSINSRQLAINLFTLNNMINKYNKILNSTLANSTLANSVINRPPHQGQRQCGNKH